jgi:hypothetical protein
MKTYDNGVVVLESEEEFLNKPSIRKRICVYPVSPLGSFSVSRIRDDKRRVTVRCHSEQDALDIAAFFADREKEKHADADFPPVASWKDAKLYHLGIQDHPLFPNTGRLLGKMWFKGWLSCIHSCGYDPESVRNMLLAFAKHIDNGMKGIKTRGPLENTELDPLFAKMLTDVPDCIGNVADYKVKVDPNAEPNTVKG